MSLKNTRIKTRKGVYKKAVVETQRPKYVDQKMLARLAIESNVFDIHDAVADNAKWLSIITTLITLLYETMPEEQKANLEPEDRELIESTFVAFAASRTRADVQIETEGAGVVIQKLIERQRKVGEILEG